MATKKRCWSFHITGVDRAIGVSIKEADILASARDKYSGIKKLKLTSWSGGSVDVPGSVHLTVQFIGPQPSQGPATLLCDLLSGTSVEARPVELRRGRKNKTKPDRSSSVVSTSDLNEEKTRTTPGTPKIHHLNDVGSADSTNDGDTSAERVNLCARDSEILDHKALRSPASVTDLPPLARIPLLEDSNFLAESVPLCDDLRVPPAGGMHWDDVVRRVGQQFASQELLGGKPSLGIEITCHASSASISSIESNDDCLSNSGGERELGEEGEEDESDEGNLYLWDHPSMHDLSDELLGPVSHSASISQQQLPMGGTSTEVHPAKQGCDLLAPDEDTTDHIDVVADTVAGAALGGDRTTLPADVRIGEILGPGRSAGLGAERRDYAPIHSTSASIRSAGSRMVGVTVEPVREIYDFEGRRELVSTTSSLAPSSNPSSNSQCHIFLKGLENLGRELSSLAIIAHFWVGLQRKVEKTAGTVRVGPDGGTYVALFYPSMKEMWPEVYHATNIRTVEVDMAVEVQSRQGEILHAGPQLKVCYRRAAEPTEGFGGTQCQRIGHESSLYRHSE